MGENAGGNAYDHARDFVLMLLKGDCLVTLKSLPDNSVDSIVTDPPYELGFMGKSWDSTGIAYNVEVWLECLRVLKPGGHLLAFGGTRTYHRIAVAIEDAGFEIRDSIHWTYGSGFPKSLDVSKAIDKAAGAEREVVGQNRYAARRPSETANSPVGFSDSMGGSATANITAPATPEAQRWQGWGTALKPSHEPIVVARKPLSEKTVAKNVVKWGTGALNIDGTRVGTTKEVPGTANSKGETSGYMGGWGDHTDEMSGKNPNIGRWPANTIITHSPLCRQVGTKSETVVTTNGKGFAGSFEGGENNNGGAVTESTTAIWNCAEGCPTKLFLDSKSPKTYTRQTAATGNINWNPKDEGTEQLGYGDEGSASRFFTQTEYDDDMDFPPFIYQAKASKADRNAGLEGMVERRPDERTETGMGTFAEKGVAKQSNFHPTVKPTSLMRHLIRLVTPPNGVVLDPFLGSGTTAVAAILENCEWVGSEITPDYWEIIEARVEWAKKQRDENTQNRLF